MSESALSGQSVSQAFQNLLMEVAEIQAHEINPQALLKEDYGLDSLDMVELIMYCEKDLRILLDDSEWQGLRTVGELQSLLVEKVSNR